MSVHPTVFCTLKWRLLPDDTRPYQLDITFFVCVFLSNCQVQFADSQNQLGQYLPLLTICILVNYY